MSESPQKNRISVKTSKAEKMNSRNGSPGELGRDTSQPARRARPRNAVESPASTAA
ncbi:hypothetical protein F2Q69_00030856 [Brassica cretica]|uniref:Uncharacterized protein n=1 Tax=Brassica cretica TaxID=69181 RepID=A0A8S9RXC3_BRACR|nr:hypothetical protein F2Q69_00030856 [Brassica cretica]